jgi:hypothetical protein
MAEPASNLRVSREYGDTIDLDMLQVAHDITQDRYFRPLTEEERVAMGEDLVKLSVQLDETELEKKEYTKMLGDKIKEIKANKAVVLQPLRTGQLEEADTLYSFMEPETHSVHVYNSKGVRVHERKMTSKERASFQLTLNA